MKNPKMKALEIYFNSEMERAETKRNNIVEIVQSIIFMIVIFGGLYILLWINSAV